MKFWIAAKRSVATALDDQKLREIVEQLGHAKASISFTLANPLMTRKWFANEDATVRF